MLRCLRGVIISFDVGRFVMLFVIFNYRHSVTTYLPAVIRVVTIMR